MESGTLKMIMEFVAASEEYRPIVEGVVKALEGYGPDLKSLMKSACVGSIDIKADCVLHLESRGFSREEAIIMTSDQWSTMVKNMQNAQNKQNKS